MAMATTPRPVPSLHRRPLGPHQHHTLTDTPTPASSTSHSGGQSTLLSSLNTIKPLAHHPSPVDHASAKPHHHRTLSNSRPLKPLASATSRLNSTASLPPPPPHPAPPVAHPDLDAWIDPIQPDDTELERKEHEASFERMMRELRDAKIEPSSAEEDDAAAASSASSSSSPRVRSGRHGRDRLEREDEQERKLGLFRDEERAASSNGSRGRGGGGQGGTRSSDFTSDSNEDDEDGSIRIGLSGVRYAQAATTRRSPRHGELDDVSSRSGDDDGEDVEHDSDDLTYVTIPRTEDGLDSPGKGLVAPDKGPYRATSASPLTTLNHASSASGAYQGHAAHAALFSSSPRRGLASASGARPTSTNENVAPAPTTSSPLRRPLGSTRPVAYSPRPLPPPASSLAAPLLRASPFSSAPSHQLRGVAPPSTRPGLVQSAPSAMAPSATTTIQYRSSPLNPNQNSPILAQKSSFTTASNEHSRTASGGSSSFVRPASFAVDSKNDHASRDGGTGWSSLAPRGGVSIEDVTDEDVRGGAFDAASSPDRTIRQAVQTSAIGNGRAGANDTTRYRLPDLTYLTEALQSPAAPSSIRVGDRGPSRSSRDAGISSLRSLVARNNEGAKARANEAGGSNGGSSSGQSKEAPLIAGALSSLTEKLRLLETENAASSSRVAHLEQQLAQMRSEAVLHDRTRQQQAKERQDRDKEQRVKDELDRLLREERQRRDALERVVDELRRENVELDQTLARQQQRERQQEEALRRQIVEEQQPQSRPEPARIAVQACPAAVELRVEVTDLKHGLQALGYEVEGVRGVVEGMLRDKEAREGEKRWIREEDERRASLSGAGRKGAEERPRANDNGGPWDEHERPGTPLSLEHRAYGESFVTDEEIERLQKEQKDEERKHRASHRRRHDHAAKKRSSARHHRAASTVSSSTSLTYDSLADSDYSPSLDSSVSSASTQITAPSESSVPLSSSEEGTIDEPDFERATRIFEDVERAERRERRERIRERALQEKEAKKSRKGDERDKSDELCKKCLAKRREGVEKEKEREVAREAAKAEEKEKARVEREKVKREEQARKVKELEKEQKKLKEREQHCKTLQAVLEKLEDDFATQKKIYLELSVEYQSMASKSSTKKRRALAEHLKMSIDVLEEKAQDVKQYADALEDLYHASHQHHHH
ncbi:hypothetical protein JCM10212_001992 [Sporobolomyces blumeae]